MRTMGDLRAAGWMNDCINYGLEIYLEKSVKYVGYPGL